MVTVCDVILFSQEDYLDFRSFEARIESTLNQLLNQRRGHPSGSVSMMVQTPGVSHGWGQTYTATPMVDMNTFNSSNNLSDATNETGRLLPTNRMDGGNISKRYDVRFYCIPVSLSLQRVILIL